MLVLLGLNSRRGAANDSVLKRPTSRTVTSLGSTNLPDGQSAHARSASIARRANLSQGCMLAPSGKSRAGFRASRLGKRDVTANRHETWGGMRWTRRCRVRMRSQGGESRERSREARKTSGSVADGQSVWSWHPLLVSSFAEAHSAQPGYEMPCNSRGDGGKRNSSPGRARHKLLKPLRGECRVISGASAVKTRVQT